MTPSFFSQDGPARSPGDPPSRVLIVDDERSILQALRRLLRKEGFEATFTDSPHEALERLRQESFAVILSDQRMPDMQGTQLLARAREISPDTIRILLTGYGDPEVAIEAINQGAVSSYISKPWDDDELRTLVRQAVTQFELRRENRQLAENLALAREQEISIAAHIQKTLLTGQIPSDLNGVQLTALTVPSQRVDGDFYDFVKYDEYLLDVMVGDVMGKGIPAALLAAAAKNQFLHVINQLVASQFREQQLPPPAEIINRLHHQLTPQLIQLESFITLCYARFDLRQQHIAYVDCGHTKTIHLHKQTGVCEALQGENLPLGFDCDEEYQQVVARFAAGDTFVFYSDGISEARLEPGHLFGQARLIELIQEYHALGPQGLIDKIDAEVKEYLNGSPLTDDLTCVALQVCEEQTGNGFFVRTAIKKHL